MTCVILELQRLYFLCAQMEAKTIPVNACYHCGNDLAGADIKNAEKAFCCEGCKTVFEILESNDLESFYDQQGGRLKPVSDADFAYLDLPEVADKLLTFANQDYSIVQLHLPAIHCSSCIWLLERLSQLHSGIRTCQVNFQNRTARIAFHPNEISLSQVANLLTSIGYKPHLNLAGLDATEKKGLDKTLLYQLGVAGFAFGNIMLLSLPEYFNMDSPELDDMAPFFRVLSLLLSLPVLLYSSQPYYKSAWAGIRNSILNIDVPIALGIIVLFLRSVYEIWFLNMPGYFDSLAGLLFFLLLGKWFQRRTYEALSFDRDYKSYFPIAITRISEAQEEQVPIYKLEVGDIIRIRNEELIPADGVLKKGVARIDASFVTGESLPVNYKIGDKVFAGGRQKGASIEIEITRPVDQSYLTALWNEGIFEKHHALPFQGITDVVSKNFTKGLLIISLIGFIAWAFVDIPTAFYVFTAVLIVACPCALALAAPFTLGNGLLILGRNGFYARGADTIENLARIDAIVFDKTGTLTRSDKHQIVAHGVPESVGILQAIRGMVRHSNHPLSRQLHEYLSDYQASEVFDFEEISGQGIRATTPIGHLRLGSADFCGFSSVEKQEETRVYLNIDGYPNGFFKFSNVYRKGLKEVASHLKNAGYTLNVLSGDHAGEATALRELLGSDTEMAFRKSPKEKLAFIDTLGTTRKVLMAGDGLNDAGALKRADVGLAVSEDIHAFSPACDAIIDAKSFEKLPAFLMFAKESMRTIRTSFIISLLYNVVGLSFALAGMLTPVYCAILMPLSSISVVGFVTLDVRKKARKIGLQTMGL
jgi:P-type Cu+ transporter